MTHLASIKTFFLVFILSTGLCLPLIVLSADSPDQVGDASKELIIKGLVRSVSVSDQTLILSQEKGQKTQFTIDRQTVFVGFSNLKDLQRKDRIKVWYRSDSTRNTAVKIVKLPELGC